MPVRAIQAHVTREFSESGMSFENGDMTDIEIFYSPCVQPYAPRFDGPDRLEIGWYWIVCAVGHDPDSDPVGPFESEAAARRNMRDANGGVLNPVPLSEFRATRRETPEGYSYCDGALTIERDGDSYVLEIANMQYADSDLGKLESILCEWAHDEGIV